MDGFLSRAARNGRLEHKQVPTTGLPDGYWALLALAVEVVTLHGPAVDSADDPRIAAFTKGVCDIIEEGTRPPEFRVLDLIEDKRMTVAAVSEPGYDGAESAADRLSRLYELTDPGRQRGTGSIGRYAMGEHGGIDLTTEVLYAPLGPHERVTQATPGPARHPEARTAGEFYDRRPGRPYRPPYLALRGTGGQRPLPLILPRPWPVMRRMPHNRSEFPHHEDHDSCAIYGRTFQLTATDDVITTHLAELDDDVLIAIMDSASAQAGYLGKLPASDTEARTMAVICGIIATARSCVAAPVYRRKRIKLPGRGFRHIDWPGEPDRQPGLKGLLTSGQGTLAPAPAGRPCRGRARGAALRVGVQPLTISVLTLREASNGYYP